MLFIKRLSLYNSKNSCRFSNYVNIISITQYSARFRIDIVASVDIFIIISSSFSRFCGRTSRHETTIVWANDADYMWYKDLICDNEKTYSFLVLALVSISLHEDNIYDVTPFLRQIFPDPYFGQQSVKCFVEGCASRD